MFIKSDMAGNIDTFSRRIKAPIAMVRKAISKEYTGSGTKFYFVTVVRAKVRKALRAKDSQKGVIRFAMKDKFKGRLVG